MFAVAVALLGLSECILSIEASKHSRADSGNTSTEFDFSLCPQNRNASSSSSNDVPRPRRLTRDEWHRCATHGKSEFRHGKKPMRRRSTMDALPDARGAHVATQAEWKACPHQRSEAIELASKYADLDGDGLICWEEIAQLKSDMLRIPEKFVLLFAAPDRIMKHCAGKDGYISRADFDYYRMSCLRNCESVMDFFYYFVDRAVAVNYKHAPVACSAKKTPEVLAESRAFLESRRMSTSKN